VYASHATSRPPREHECRRYLIAAPTANEARLTADQWAASTPGSVMPAGSTAAVQIRRLDGTELALCGREFGTWKLARAHESRCRKCWDLRCRSVITRTLVIGDRDFQCTLAEGHDGKHVNRHRYNYVPHWE
jgi:hypothetical protein